MGKSSDLSDFMALRTDNLLRCINLLTGFGVDTNMACPVRVLKQEKGYLE